MSRPQTRLGAAATAPRDRTHNTSDRNRSTACTPWQLLLGVHERSTGYRERKSGNGCTITCAACGTASHKVAVTEFPNGSLGVHAFCGHLTHEVLGAMGLQMADLFPRRDLRTLSPAERSQFRQAALLPKWRVALDVLSLESDVLLIAGNQLADNQPLSDADLTRVRVACLRIFDAKEVLHAR